MLLFYFLIFSYGDLELSESFQFTLGDWELINPMSVTVDANNNFLIVDQKANKVYVFDDKGNPIRSFGQKGLGPGEFNLIDRTNIIAQGERVIIADGYSKDIYIYDRQYEFIKKVRLSSGFKHIYAYGNNFLLHTSSTKKRSQSVMLYNNDFEKVKTLFTMPDETWEQDSSGAWIRSYYVEKYVINSFNDFHLIANSSKPVIKMFSNQNEKSTLEKEVQIPFKTHKLTEEEKEDLKTYAKINKFNIKVLDEHWTIHKIMNYKNKAIVVTQDLTTDQYQMKGICLDQKGNTLGAFSTVFQDISFYQSTKHGIVVFDTSTDEIMPKLYLIKDKGVDIAD